MSAAACAAIPRPSPVKPSRSSVMLMDAEVFLVEGSEENLKLTTPADIYAASAIIDARGDFL